MVILMVNGQWLMVNFFVFATRKYLINH